MRRPVRPRDGRRILFFEPYANVFAGSHRFVVSLAQVLMDREYTVRVMTTGVGVFTDHLDRLAIPWVSADLPDSLMVYGHATRGRRAARAVIDLPVASLRLANRLRGEVDVVHATDIRGALLLGPAARLAGVPLIWHAHASTPEPNKWLNRAARAVSRAVVAPSVAAARAIPGLAPSRIEVIANAAPPEAFLVARPEVPDALIVTAARLHPDKGLEVLMEAMALVTTQRPEARLLVLGGPIAGYEEYARALALQAQDVGPNGAISMVGNVDDPFGAWSRAAVYVQPSLAESFGIAVLEAMAGGLPVVASRVGGLEELVDDDRTGMLVPPGDPGALARAIIALLSDRQRARSMGEAGQVKARSFAWPAVADRFGDLYRRLTR